VLSVVEGSVSYGYVKSYIGPLGPLIGVFLASNSFSQASFVADLEGASNDAAVASILAYMEEKRRRERNFPRVREKMVDIEQSLSLNSLRLMLCPKSESFLEVCHCGGIGSQG